MKREIAVALGVTVLVGGLSPAVGQERTTPADAIRVVEHVDAGRRLERAVVEDLGPDEILLVQIELRRAGFDPRARRGVLDSATRRALTSFQTARGLEICGCVTYETVVALGIVPIVVARIEAEDARPAATYGAYGRTTIVDRTAFVVVVPTHGRQHRRDVGPAVVVGHEPAVGAGQLRHRANDRYRGRHSDVRRPVFRPQPEPPGVGRRIVPRDAGDNGTGTSPTRTIRPAPRR